MSSMQTLLAYLPLDRRQAIAAGSELSRQTHGSALWADLSGFTALAETLTNTLGSRHGAEELALHLNRFYDALIAPVDAYGGSVVGFSGDAITCWFDADNGQRAVAAGQTMQIAMQPFISLQPGSGESISVGVKIAIASGSVRRLQVGDPAIQTFDTLAGTTMERLFAIGHLAATGELLLDEPTETQLREIVKISQWRTNPETGQRAAVLNSLNIPIEPAPQTSTSSDLNEAHVRHWLLPSVFVHLQNGQGEFLTELRPATALFMRFDGLNYDQDEQVGDKLDAIICWVQQVLLEYDGTLLQLTLGDKGSYLYAAFGAPTAHEDDITRAVAAALQLRLLPTQINSIDSIRIGLSQGIMRTGAYGSTTRRTYGVLGDEVNLAARLMEHAAPNEILSSEAIWQAAPNFHWQILPALKVKGKRDAFIPAALIGRLEENMLHLPQAAPTLPMIGRHTELALMIEKLELARRGHGQIVSIIGEAGMGKSRLLAEALQHANGLTQYGGECQSYGTQNSYLVWQSIWRAFFGIHPTSSPAEQIGTLEKALAEINPDYALRLPLLGVALNLSIPDNELTRIMDAQSRKMSRETLLTDCIRAWAGQKPLILILEDVHWIDPLSRDLLIMIGQVIKDLPVLILLACRPPKESISDLLNLKHATEIHLTELTNIETEQLITARLIHFGLENAASSQALTERVSARTQGNPFYTEELLNYLHERGLDPRLDSSWAQTDLPESLHSLILSRIDQLSERQQITIKAASIIGRLFQAAWLYGYYPPLGGAAQVSADLELLNRMDFTVKETPEPHLAYLFKHVITQEVAYESLAYATRAGLHEQFASYLELVAGSDVRQFLDLLAYHYERSPNLPKKLEYLFKAGDAAEAAFANETAISYYLGALETLTHLPVTDENQRTKADITFKLVSVSFSAHNPQQNLARLTEIETMLKELSGPDGLPGSDKLRLARTHYWMGRSHYLSSNTPAAIGYYKQVLAVAQELNDPELLAIPSGVIGHALTLQGRCNQAEQLLWQAIEPLAKTNNWLEWLRTVGFLGMVLTSRGDRTAGSLQGQRALDQAEKIKNPVGLTLMRIFYGMIHIFAGDLTMALEKLQIVMETTELSSGPIYGHLVYNLLGWTHSRLGNYQTALENFAKAKPFAQVLGGRLILADVFAAAEAEAFATNGRYEEAITLAQTAITISLAGSGIIGQGIAERALATALSHSIIPARRDDAETHLAASLQCLEAGDNRLEAARTQVAWGIISRDRGNISAAREHFEKAAAQFEYSGMVHELAQVQDLVSTLT